MIQIPIDYDTVAWLQDFHAQIPAVTYIFHPATGEESRLQSVYGYMNEAEVHPHFHQSNSTTNIGKKHRVHWAVGESFPRPVR